MLFVSGSVAVSPLQIQGFKRIGAHFRGIKRGAKISMVILPKIRAWVGLLTLMTWDLLVVEACKNWGETLKGTLAVRNLGFGGIAFVP